MCSILQQGGLKKQLTRARSLKWVSGNCPGQVKATGLMFTTSPIECRSISKISLPEPDTLEGLRRVVYFLKFLHNKRIKFQSQLAVKRQT